MNQEDLDRVLARQGNIVPSSGFVANVMNAVEREASTPPPIPFPWRYALPAITAWLIALIVLLALGPFDVTPTAVPRATPVLEAIIQGFEAIDGGWIAVALLVSAASVFLSMRIADA